MKRHTMTAGALVVLLLFSGCAGLNQPRTFVYPAMGQHPDQQVLDRVSCEDWARGQTGYDAAGHAVAGATGGAMVGATVGAIIGAIVCAPIKASGSCAALGAAVGGASGMVHGAAANVAAGQENFSRAFASCMAAKGYASAPIAGPPLAPAAVIAVPPPPPGPPPPPPPPNSGGAPLGEIPSSNPGLLEAPDWCKGEGQEWLGTACLTRMNADR